MSSSFIRDVVGPGIHSNTLDLISLWKQKTQLAKGRPFDAEKDLIRCIVDIIIGTTFGFQVNSLRTHEAGLEKTVSAASLDTPITFGAGKDNEAFTSIRALEDSVQIAMSSSFPRIVLPLALRFLPSLASAKRYTDKMIEDQLKTAWSKFSKAQDLAGNDQVKSVADLLVQREVQMAGKENRKANYNNPVVRNELFGFFLAGQKTTSATLCWAVKYLGENQPAQKKLRDAIKSAHQRAAKAGHAPSAEDMMAISIPYLDAFIHEVHRLGNSLSCNIRVTTKDVVILGQVVPKGTDVFMITNGPGYQAPALIVEESKRSKSSQALKDKYGSWEESTIENFEPERWLINKDDGSVRFNQFAGPAMPFGAGPRSCFGQSPFFLSNKITSTRLLCSELIV
jgi:cytochrome P450